MTDNQIDKALKTCKRALFYVVFFGFIVSFLTIATSLYSLQVFDRVFSSGSYETLVMLTIIMIIFSAILSFVQAIRSEISFKIGEYLDRKLASLTIDLSFTALKKDGNKAAISQNLRDLHIIKNFIASPNLIHAIDAPWSLIFIIIIFIIHPLLGIIVSVGAILLLLCAWINNSLTKKLVVKSSEISSMSYKELDVMAKNVEVIEALRMKSNLLKNWHEIHDKNFTVSSELHLKQNTISNISKFFRGLIYVSTVAFGAVLVIGNKMSSGGIMACSILSSKALAPFDAAISLWGAVINAKKSYERLKNLAKDNYVEVSNITLPKPEGRIEIEKIGFVSPKTSKPIIRGVNITINAGEIVAIIGPTAAGKSTLAKLVMGILKPTTGFVRFDGADILNWKEEDLAKYIGYLPQDIELFNGNVKTNIARMDKKPKDSEVIDAAKLAHVHDLIVKLPKGYETDIGVWGANISAGQRQRIALARAFFGDPKLVVLDEPNSNLDQEGEIALAKTLQVAKEKKITTLIISHRQQILDSVDKILVLYEGEAKFYDKKDEVLKKLKS